MPVTMNVKEKMKPLGARQIDAAMSARIAPLLPAIYAAATDASRWPDAFAQIVRLLGGNSGMIFSHQATPEQQGIWVPYRLADEDLKRYAERYHAFDIWMQRALKLQEAGAFVPGNVMTSDELLPRKEFLASVFYREFLALHDVCDLLASMLHGGSEPDIPLVHVAIHRPKSAPLFGEAEKELLAALIPHLQEATRIGFRLGALEQQVGVTQAAVETLSPALVLLNAQGTVVFANGRAQAILAANDRLRMVAGRLVVEVKQQARLDALLKTSSSQETMLGITRPSGIPNLWLIRVPIPRNGKSVPDARRPAVALMIHDSSVIDKIDLKGFAKVHGLTPAEARVMDLLLEHGAPSLIADELGVTLHTVRCQLRAIREKTGARRQAEMVRMLMSWPRRID